MDLGRTSRLSPKNVVFSTSIRSVTNLNAERQGSSPGVRETRLEVENSSVQDSSESPAIKYLMLTVAESEIVKIPVVVLEGSVERSESNETRFGAKFNGSPEPLVSLIPIIEQISNREQKNV